MRHFVYYIRTNIPVELNNMPLGPAENYYASNELIWFTILNIYKEM